MLSKHNSWSKEQYLAFDKKYKMIFEELYGSEMEIPIGNDKQRQFSNGFSNCDYTSWMMDEYTERGSDEIQY